MWLQYKAQLVLTSFSQLVINELGVLVWLRDLLVCVAFVEFESDSRSRFCLFEMARCRDCRLLKCGQAASTIHAPEQTMRSLTYTAKKR